MPSEFDIQFEPGSLERLQEVMRRLQNETGKSALEAVKFTAYNVAQRLGESTKKARSKRKLYKNPGNNQRYPAKVFPYYVTVWRKGKPVRKYLKAESKVTSPWRVIKYAGLARSSWKWDIGKLGKKYRSAKIPRMPGVTTTTIRLSETDPQVEITNRLRYMATILRHDGKRPVQSALTRASAKLTAYLDRRLQKAAAKA